MRRYLILCRRERTIRAALKAAKLEDKKNNVLSSIEFTAPLSVHGESSAVVVRAENMNLRKIPVALDLDEKGEHRGTSMETVRTRLVAAETPMDDFAILAAYEDY